MDNGIEEKSLESPWISVKDALPPINVFVLVSVNDNRYQSIHLGCLEIFRDELEWFKADCSCCEFPGENVTHWMPLPKFPEITPE